MAVTSKDAMHNEEMIANEVDILDLILCDGFHPQPSSKGGFRAIRINNRTSAIGPKTRHDIFVIRSSADESEKADTVKGVIL